MTTGPGPADPSRKSQRPLDPGAGPPRDPAAELDRLDRVFKALAHPSRRQVLLIIHFRGGSMGAGEIANRFACTWPTTTRHLKVLCDCGLVRVERRGRERRYTLDRELLQRVVGGWLSTFDPGHPS